MSPKKRKIAAPKFTENHRHVTIECDIQIENAPIMLSDGNMPFSPHAISFSYRLGEVSSIAPVRLRGWGINKRGEEMSTFRNVMYYKPSAMPDWLRDYLKSSAMESAVRLWAHGVTE